MFVMSHTYARKRYTAHVLRNGLQEIRWSCFPRLLCLMFTLVLSVSTLLAETFVSGEVSGVWDTDGSPYLVTDTLIVPGGDTLLIEPGVIVEFQDQTDSLKYPVIVLGALLANGALGDSILFVSEDFAFGGFRAPMDSEDSRIEMSYCVVDSVQWGFDLYYGSTHLQHSRVVASYRFFKSEFNTDSIEYCYFNSILPDSGFPLMNISLLYGEDYTFINNTAPLGNVALNGNSNPVHHNFLGQLSVRSDTTIIHDNQFYNCSTIPPLAQTSHVDFYNNQVRLEDSVNIARCVTFRESEAMVHNNTFPNLLAHDSSVNIFDNIIISDRTPHHATIVLNTCTGTVHRNVISGDAYADNFRLDLGGNITVSNNTIKVNGDRGIWLRTDVETTIENNIFLGDGGSCTAIERSVNGLQPASISYNSFYEFEEITGDVELDEGNLFENPFLAGGDPFDYTLQANSPCIDAGDPDSDDDPDGTRADIGCFYYDQSIDNPPVQTIPEEVFAQTGLPLRIQITATDDNGPFSFTFPDLPEWLSEEDELDWVGDTTAVSGIVPEDAEDFSFTVIVEDGEGQTDSSIVTVDVDQRTLLSGEISGTLCVEDSPFYVVEDIVVPEGDSLVIEPGCELQFRYVEDEEQQIGIDCYGTLIAEGMVGDSIRFTMDNEEAVIGGWAGIKVVGNGDTSRVMYTVFAYGQSCIITDSLAIINIANSCFIQCELYTLDINSNSTISIIQCRFFTDVDRPFRFIYGRNSFISIDSCIFIDVEMETFGSSGITVEYSELYISNSHFYRAKGISLNYESVGHIRNNYFYGVGVSESNNSSLTIENNIFYAAERIIENALVFSSPTDIARNNVFIEHDRAVRFFDNSGGSFFPVIMNNIFQDCSIGIQNNEDLNRNFLVQYNCFWSNDTLAVSCPLDSTNLFVNPGFADSLCHLYEDSPLIDAGHPDSSFFDLDGTRNDIGRWGGPYGELYEYPDWIKEAKSDLPTEFQVFSPYPNPFNSFVTVSYAIPSVIDVDIRIYNLVGQTVLALPSSRQLAGKHSITFEAASLASGMYIIEIKAGKEVERQKAILLK